MRPPLSRCAIAAALAVTLAAVAGWLFVIAATAAPAFADTTGRASDVGLQRDAIAVNHAVTQQFPQIVQISGWRPDPIGGHGDGRIEADGEVGLLQVVVDGLGYIHHRNSQLMQSMGDAEGSVSPDADEGIQLEVVEVFDHRLRDILFLLTIGKWIGPVGGPQDGSSSGQYSRDILPHQFPGLVVDQALKAILDADHLGVVTHKGGLGDCSNSWVQSRTVTACG